MRPARRSSWSHAHAFGDRVGRKQDYRVAGIEPCCTAALASARCETPLSAGAPRRPRRRTPPSRPCRGTARPRARSRRRRASPPRRVHRRDSRRPVSGGRQVADDVDDDVRSLLIDPKRRDLGETARLHHAHLPWQRLRPAPVLDPGGIAGMIAHRIGGEEVGHDLDVVGSPTSSRGGPRATGTSSPAARAARGRPPANAPAMWRPLARRVIGDQRGACEFHLVLRHVVCEACRFHARWRCSARGHHAPVGCAARPPVDECARALGIDARLAAVASACTTSAAVRASAASAAPTPLLRFLTRACVEQRRRVRQDRRQASPSSLLSRLQVDAEHCARRPAPRSVALTHRVLPSSTSWPRNGRASPTATSTSTGRGRKPSASKPTTAMAASG